MTKQVQHQVSLKRPDGWYSADNEMVTVFAPLIGPYAFSVYHLLKQRSFLEEDKRGISHLGISEALTMSKDSVGNALATLKQFYLLEELPPVSTNKPPRYEVIHAKDALGSHPEIRTWLAAELCKKPKTRILKSGRDKQAKEVPQFPQSHPEIRTRVRTKRVLKSGRSAGEIQDGDGRNSGHGHPEIRTPNKEEVLKEKVQEQDRAPLPPVGGIHQPIEDQDFETQNEAAVADGVVWCGEKVLAAVDLGHRRSPDRQPPANLQAAPAAKTPAATGTRLAADGLTPVRDTLAGLLNNLKADKPADERTPRELAAFFLQYLHEQFANAFTVQKPGTDWEDPYQAWMRCFDHVRVGDVEADGNQMVVLLETPNPKDLVAGLTKYRAKVQLAMTKAFGREVQLVPRLEAA